MILPITFDVYVYGSNACYGNRSLYKFSMDDVEGTWEKIFTHDGPLLSGNLSPHCWAFLQECGRERGQHHRGLAAATVRESSGLGFRV